LMDRFKRAYPSVEPQQQIQVKFADGTASTDTALVGYKMTAKNALDVLLVQRGSLGTIRLAPYETWEALRSTAEENYTSSTRVVGRRKIKRIGARYVNRLDLPSPDIEGKPLSNFLKVLIAIPEDLSASIGPYQLVVDCIERSTGSKVHLVSGIVTPPPLLDHVSITLDIDASLDENIPTRMEEVWKCADVLRKAANAVFENAITDALRGYIR